MLPNPSEPEHPGSRPGERRFPRDGHRPPFGPPPGLVLVRVAVVALGLAIAVVLLSRGDVVLGGLLLAFAALRAVMLVAMRRRRAQWRAARGRPG